MCVCLSPGHVPCLVDAFLQLAQQLRGSLRALTHKPDSKQQADSTEHRDKYDRCDWCVMVDWYGEGM